MFRGFHFTKNHKARAARYLKGVERAGELKAGVAAKPVTDKERASPRQREYVEQKAVFEWAKHREDYVPALWLLHAIPNGGSRSKRQDPRTGKWFSPEGKRFKAMGVKAGVPDVFLPVARKGYHGLYLEMKVDSVKDTRTSQEAWLTRLSAEGYLCKVCVGRGPAIEALIEYLDIPARWQ